MNKVNYAAMSDRQLKRYFLTHRDDKEAFYAYMDRRHTHSRGVAIAFDDPLWEEKVVSAIQEQLNGDRLS